MVVARKKGLATLARLVINIYVNIYMNIIMNIIINIYIKFVVTRKKGLATSARLVRFVRAWRRVTPVVCCSLVWHMAYVHMAYVHMACVHMKQKREIDCVRDLVKAS